MTRIARMTHLPRPMPPRPNDQPLFCDLDGVALPVALTDMFSGKFQNTSYESGMDRKDVKLVYHE